MDREGKRIGPYQLIGELGRGGMGDVFAARHERTEQVVALKVLKPEKARSPEHLARFRQEGRALFLLEREEIAPRLLHYEEFDDGAIVLAMERLEGESLRQWLSHHPGPHRPDVALEIGRRLAEILVKVHARGVIHRDVKPENIFLCASQAPVPGHPIKLLDFGIAKVPQAVEEPRTDTRLQTRGLFLMGTPEYMAPEQVYPGCVDGQADVYALGVVLFELLAGSPPFEGAGLIYQHQKNKPPRLQDRVPGLPEGLCTLIAAMLAKEPGERPSMSHCWRQLGQDWTVGARDNPIPGLAAFSQDQSELFVGRSRELRELLELLEESRDGRKRWLQLEGPGGVGKTSLVQAGVLPSLQAHLPHQARRWQLVNLLPAPHPARSLALALHAALSGFGLALTPQQLEEVLLSSSSAVLGELVREHLPSDLRLLLVIEQLEEFLTLDEAERQRWDGWLCTALDTPSCPLRLLTTLRGDFIPLLRQLPRLERHLNEAVRYNLAPLESEALTHVVQEVAQRVGLSLDKNLPERMVRDAPSEGSRLSLLSHTLRELWELRGGGLLTHQHYEGLGGVDGILTRQAETLLNALGEDGRQRAKWIVLSLVQVGRGLPVLRRTRTWREVLEEVGADDETGRVLRQLSGMHGGAEGSASSGLRLIVVSSESEPGQQRVELIHDTLLQNVLSIQQWIHHERARLERLTDLEAAAQEWVQADRQRSYLSTGTLLKQRLKAVRRPSQRGARALGASEQATQFLEASRRFDRRQSTLRVALSTALVLITFLALWQTKRIEQLLQLSVDNHEDFAFNVDWTLGRRSHTLEARRFLLDRSEERVEKIFEEYSNILATRLLVSYTLQRRSDLAFHDERLSDARARLDRDSHLVAEGLKSHQGNSDLLSQSCLNFSKQGKIALAAGKTDETRELFTQANECFSRLPSDDSSEGRRARATSLSEYADLDAKTGRFSEATRGYTQAIDLLEKNPEAYDQSLLAETLGSRAQAAWKTDHKTAAEDDFQRALKLARRIHQDEPGDTYYQWVLAGILVKRAEFLHDSGADEPLAPLYEEALSLSRVIHEGEVPNKRYALVLAQSLLGMERVMRAAHDDAQATALQAERCRLVGDFMREDPEDVRFQEFACP